MKWALSFLLVTASWASEAWGAPGPLPGDVQSILERRCAECHGRKAVKGRLNLSTPTGLARGGKSGVVVRPGKVAASLLWRKVDRDEMPPEHPLPAAERLVLRKWIEAGAEGLPAAPALTHWAFVVPHRPPVPQASGPGARNPIDAFLDAALAEKRLARAAEADRTILLRRVAFDLTGLPPTLEEIDAFQADTSEEAYTRMVEHYLASPHYGERWGKYWLDAAGYADSNGYFNADSDRPLAWKYRDYVVRSFNKDKPFDQFVREQLAGDELAGCPPSGDATPEMAELLTATHFLRNAPDGSGESDGNPDEVRTDRLTVLEGNLQITMNTLLGVTIQCARCHDHKFEPIAQEDYYRLQAILSPVYHPDHWVKPNDRIVTVATPQQRQEHHRRMERIDRQVQSLQAGLATMAAVYRERLLEERFAALDPSLREEVLQADRAPKEKRSPAQEALVKKYIEPLKSSDDDLAGRFPEYAALREQVRKVIAARQKDHPPPLETLAVVRDLAGPPLPHHLKLRGVHNRPGKEVQPGAPAALSGPRNDFSVAPIAGSSGRRTALARWVTGPTNPLFARVFVNRIWQHHFGKGLVATPDNFGQSGARPSHPELLDWLAVEFVESGYSVKHLHRLIVHSAAWRQWRADEKTTARARVIDPDNRLLWRYEMRRLDAEAIRDAMLAVSGELDQRPGGPYVPTDRTSEGNVEVTVKDGRANRRSIYLQQRRTQVATFLELFDAPSMAITCTARNASTVPLQALALLNSHFARRRASAFADRLQRQAAREHRIVLAFRLGLGRPPDVDEWTAALKFIDKQYQLYAPSADAEQKAWTDLCQMLLASSGFLYLE
jgi:hypothetical protein